MAKDFLSVFKRCLLIGAILGLVGYIGSCHFTKRKYESRALIKDVKQLYQASFNNYKYCVRPMFAADRVRALRLWRREIDSLEKQCANRIEKHSCADKDVISAVQNLIWTLERVESALSDVDPSLRKKIQKRIMDMDREYKSFSNTAEQFDCFVERIDYSEEYK